GHRLLLFWITSRKLGPRQRRIQPQRSSRPWRRQRTSEANGSSSARAPTRFADRLLDLEPTPGSSREPGRWPPVECSPRSLAVTRRRSPYSTCQAAVEVGSRVVDRVGTCQPSRLRAVLRRGLESWPFR